MPSTIRKRRSALIASTALLLCAALITVLAIRGATADAKLSTSAKLSAAADNSIKFNTNKITVAHGKVTLTMANPSDVPHGVAIKGHGVDKSGKIVGKGGSSKVTVKLKKGTYTYYCPFMDHASEGMKGKLTVK